MTALDVLHAALLDDLVIARYRGHIHPHPTPSGCWIWTGALSGAGHGRFWLSSAGGRGHVIVAHRFGYALRHGLDELTTTAAIRHRCDEPFCQNTDHMLAGTIAENTSEWAIRRNNPGSPLRDTRGPLGRAQAIRAAALNGDDLVAALGEGAPPNDRYQRPLF